MTHTVTRRVVAGLAGLALAQMPLRLMAQTRISSPGGAGGGGGSAPSIGGGITGGTTGSVLFVGPGSTFAEDNPNFFWDNTNNRLGIGTAAPAKRLEILSTGSDHLRLTHTAGTKLADLFVNSDGDLDTRPTRHFMLNFSDVLGVFQFLAAGTAAINFTSNTAGVAKLGSFSLDASGNFIFRHTSAGSMFFDFVTSAIFRDSGFAQRLVISSAGLTLPAGSNLVLATTTGTKIGTATNQLLSFYGVTPVDQPATVADPTGGAFIDAESRTAIIAVIDRLQELGLVA